MARKLKKAKDVVKFGGVDELGKVGMHGHEHDVSTIEAKSTRHLEEDIGEGNAAILRCFTFAINPQVFKEHPPTKQELFNHHHKGIELALWRDGMKVMPEVNPKIVVNQKKMQYQIFVGAQPMKGYILQERPQTLSEIAHG
jgi:hypothetical protein